MSKDTAGGGSGIRGYQALAVACPPANEQAYRSLVPQGFDMPEQPLVQINVTAYDNVGVGPITIRPFYECHLGVLVVYRGQPGWLLKSSPFKGNWFIYQSGLWVGFPKYLPDRFEFDRVGEGWRVQIEHGGAVRFALAFTPRAAATPPAEYARIWEDIARRTLPVFTQMPIGKGPKVNRTDLKDMRPANWNITPGEMCVTLGDREPGGGQLIAPGTVAYAIHHTYSGLASAVVKKAGK